jgi:hypothetical protein
MKTYGGVEVWLHTFLTLVLDGGKWTASYHGCSTPGERGHNSHCIGGFVGPKASVDVASKRNISAPTRNQILTIQPMV